VLRSPSEPGVRVKKAVYKPGRNWVSTTLTDYYIQILDLVHSFLYCVIKRVTTSSPRTLLSALRHETTYVMKRGELVTITPLQRLSLTNTVVLNAIDALGE